jgi:hypothetical protein
MTKHQYQRLGILITSQRILTGTLHKELIAKLSQEYTVVIIHPSTVLIQPNQYPELLKVKFNIGNIEHKLQKFILDLESYRLMDLNPSFESRVRLLLGVHFDRKLTLKTIIASRSCYALMLWTFVKFMKIDFFRSLTHAFSDSISKTGSLISKLALNKILIFSGGNYSGIENSVLAASKRHSITSYLIVDNWDNLSSKSLLWHEPSKLGVWGEGMMKEATEIHNFPIKNMQVLGSPRIHNSKVYVRKPDKTLRILFAGSGLQHSHELEILKELDARLSKGSKKWRILYKPHPISLRSPSLPEDLVSVNDLICTEIESEALMTKQYGFYEPESIKKLQDLILGSDLVVAMHSTVIVESLHLGKEVITYSQGELGVFEGVNVWDNYTHLNRLRENPNVYEFRKRGEFYRFISQFTPKPQSSNLAPKIIQDFESSYTERVMNFLAL